MNENELRKRIYSKVYTEGIELIDILLWETICCKFLVRYGIYNMFFNTDSKNIMKDVQFKIWVNIRSKLRTTLIQK